MKKQLVTFAALAAAAFHALAANPTVSLKTSEGEIVVELFAEQAPKSTANFVQYVEDGHYNGTVFHRVIDGFMIQGGGLDAGMRQKQTRSPIENEAQNGLKNERGTLAMARTADPHSATAQFFINLVHNAFLDYPSRDGWGYAVFGKVVSGMDVVDRIAKTKTGNKGFHQDVPAKEVVIEEAVLTKSGAAEAAAQQD